MIITCQNCQTHYKVDANVLGGGMAVQCHNCGNSWHQNPVRAPVQLAPPPPPPRPVYAEPAPMQPAAAPPPPPPPELEPEPAPLPIPEPEPEPAPLPDLDAELEPAPEPDAGADADAETEAMEAEAAEAEGEAGGVDEALSQEQLDEMFGEDTEPDAFQSLSETDAPAATEDEEMPDIDSIPDPEPIPQVFSPDDEGPVDGDEAKGGGKMKIVAIAAVVLVIALGAGAFFGRGFIIGLWPGAAGIYSMVGLGGDELGAGLDIQNVKSSRDVEGGVDVLVVRGVVANVSEDERQVPMIRVTLYDGNGDEVQHVVASPLKNRLPGGAKIGFRAKLSEPSALARRLEVTFTEAEKTGG